MDPVTLAIGGAVVGGGLSAYQASQKNKGIQRSMDAANQATSVELQQVEAQRRQEVAKRIRDSEKVRGIIAVNAAERGVGTGGSVSALDRQALYDEGTNVGTVNTNAANTSSRVLSDLNATNIHLANSASSVLASLFQGGIQGASTGLSIGRAVGGPTPSAMGQPNDASSIMPGDDSQGSAFA